MGEDRENFPLSPANQRLLDASKVEQNQATEVVSELEDSVRDCRAVQGCSGSQQVPVSRWGLEDLKLSWGCVTVRVLSSTPKALGSILNMD